MQTNRVIISFVACALLASATARGGSIYARSSHRARSLYADDTARYVGDIVTIVIEEHSKIESGTKRSLEKTSSRKGDLEGTFQFKDLIPSLLTQTFDFPKLDFDSSSQTKQEGTADYGKDRKLTDKITVTVEDVLPNGNLVVLGKRRRRVDGDFQLVQISGIVRTSDINFDNEVSSKKIADFHVVYSEGGLEKRFTNPGWLNRFLNLINPF